MADMDPNVAKSSESLEGALINHHLHWEGHLARMYLFLSIEHKALATGAAGLALVGCYAKKSINATRAFKLRYRNKIYLTIVFYRVMLSSIVPSVRSCRRTLMRCNIPKLTTNTYLFRLDQLRIRPLGSMQHRARARSTSGSSPERSCLASPLEESWRGCWRASTPSSLATGCATSSRRSPGTWRHTSPEKQALGPSSLRSGRRTGRPTFFARF